MSSFNIYLSTFSDDQYITFTLSALESLLQTRTTLDLRCLGFRRSNVVLLSPLSHSGCWIWGYVPFLAVARGPEPGSGGVFDVVSRSSVQVLLQLPLQGAQTGPPDERVAAPHRGVCRALRSMRVNRTATVDLLRNLSPFVNFCLTFSSDSRNFFSADYSVMEGFLGCLISASDRLRIKLVWPLLLVFGSIANMILLRLMHSSPCECTDLRWLMQLNRVSALSRLLQKLICFSWWIFSIWFVCSAMINLYYLYGQSNFNSVPWHQIHFCDV